MGQIQGIPKPIPDKTAVHQLSTPVTQKPLRMLFDQLGGLFDDEWSKPETGCEASRPRLYSEFVDALWKLMVELEPTAHILLKAVIDLKNIQGQFRLSLLEYLQVFTKNGWSDFLKIVIPGTPTQRSSNTFSHLILASHAFEVNREGLWAI